jgi:hypothetical protein
MKKKAFVLFSLFSAVTASAQEVVSTQGDSYSHANGIIDFKKREVDKHKKVIVVAGAIAKMAIH